MSRKTVNENPTALEMLRLAVDEEQEQYVHLQARKEEHAHAMEARLLREGLDVITAAVTQLMPERRRLVMRHWWEVMETYAASRGRYEAERLSETVNLTKGQCRERPRPPLTIRALDLLDPKGAL